MTATLFALRQEIRDAARELRIDPNGTMGRAMTLLALAASPEEAAALMVAYADMLRLHKGMSPEAATAQVRRNVRFGIAYMEQDQLWPLYFPDEPAPSLDELADEFSLFDSARAAANDALE